MIFSLKRLRRAKGKKVVNADALHADPVEEPADTSTATSPTHLLGNARQDPAADQGLALCGLPSHAAESTPWAGTSLLQHSGTGAGRFRRCQMLPPN